MFQICPEYKILLKGKRELSWKKIPQDVQYRML